MINFTSKQRAYLRSLAHGIDPIFQIGKNGFTPEVTTAINEALETKELIKINVLKNCSEEPKEIGPILAERTRSTLIQVMGRKITLYRESEENKEIEIPRAK